MYGTIARLQAKAGAQAEVAALAREMRGVEIPGLLAWIRTISTTIVRRECGMTVPD
jgi:hypothetical protein